MQCYAGEASPSSSPQPAKRQKTGYPSDTAFHRIAQCAFALLQTMDDQAVIFKIAKSRSNGAQLWLSTTCKMCPHVQRRHEGNNIFMRIDMLRGTLELGCWDEGCGGAIGLGKMNPAFIHVLPREAFDGILDNVAQQQFGDWWSMWKGKVLSNYDGYGGVAWDIPVQFAQSASREGDSCGSTSGSRAYPSWSEHCSETLLLGFTEQWHYTWTLENLEMFDRWSLLQHLLQKVGCKTLFLPNAQLRNFAKRAKLLWHPDRNVHECDAVRGERRAWFVALTNVLNDMDANCNTSECA